MPKGIKGFQEGNDLGGRTKANHTIAKEKARETVTNAVAERLKPLLDAKFDLAFGHYRVINTKNGTMRVYRVSPDGNAIQFLFNYAFGKATDTIKMEGEVEFIYKEDDNNFTPLT